MNKYCVVKYFGHFRQEWEVEADSEESAWDMAEKNGQLTRQIVYILPFDKSEKGYVINLNNKDGNNRISDKQYCEWLKEAADMGMILRPYEYEKCYGIPFNDVW